MDPRRQRGRSGEQVAERELAARGIGVVARNARTRYGEIDLVCRDASGYVFVEVKTRRAGSFVSSREAADARKVRRLASLAAAWLAHAGQRAAAYRLVIVGVTLGAGAPAAEVIDVDRVP